MAWKIEFDTDVEKDLKKLGHSAQKRVIKYLKEQVIPAEDPRSFGKPLSGNLSGLWRYRTGDYRIIAKIENDHFIILIVHIGHRKNVYD
ncbi:type II toxin-antitoxin system RelE/ParE family toxin [Legionella sp.]|uniref:type II toxin-antitoxin system RelE family toxin n=1 Tax=Legionella sp. TaxID=459 RepID=UPI000CC66C7A|nr:type II toxin-antitoxin system RelE/ParE family toxin [Legionella sp.]PJE06491.1 MAG: type II toxin-antitoxin system mRNA interferase toxin, RelE/StbE family [Legionella sp.]